MRETCPGKEASWGEAEDTIGDGDYWEYKRIRLRAQRIDRLESEDILPSETGGKVVCVGDSIGTYLVV